MKLVHARLCGGTGILRGACVQHQKLHGRSRVRSMQSYFGFQVRHIDQANRGIAVSTSTVVWRHGFEPTCWCQDSRGTDVRQQRHRSEYLVRGARLMMHICVVSRVTGAWHHRHGLSRHLVSHACTQAVAHSSVVLWHRAELVYGEEPVCNSKDVLNGRSGA